MSRIGQLKTTLRRRTTSLAAWELPKEESTIAPPEVYTNKDLDPSTPEQRLWTGWTLIAYWGADLINPGAWAGVSSYVTSLGLLWWEAILAKLLGSLLVAFVITANGWIGATVHTPFAVTSRATYGYWGSKFPVFSRMVVASLYVSTNSWQGAIYLQRMIEAIWPSFSNLHNSVPKAQGATTQNFICFFLFWVIQTPFIFIHPSKLGLVYKIKAVLVPLLALAMMTWGLVIARHDLSTYLNHQSNRAAPGLARWTAFTYAMTVQQGTWATMAINIGDFTRYQKKPASAYVQLFALPFFSALLGVFGALTGACILGVYGKALYQPYDVIALWKDSHGGRAAMFIAGFIWALAQVITNLSANSISAANDLTSLAPKYINIFRGQLLVCLVGYWGFAPWKVVASATSFLSFLSSYGIVLAPMGTLMAVDFFLIKKRKLNIYELYRPKGIYSFGKTGINWRAYVALFIAIAPNMPGMVNAINPKIDIGGAKYIYKLSNVVGNIIAIVVYLTLNYFFPPQRSIVEVEVHDLYTTEDGIKQVEDVEEKHKEPEDVYVLPVDERR